MRPVRTFSLIVAAILGLILAAQTLPVGASDAPGDHSGLIQYRHTGWRVVDGDIPDAPTALAQTRDGYVWVGTASGLLRFDGARFVRQPTSNDPNTSSPEILSLFPDGMGNLWIGTGSGIRELSGTSASTVKGGRGRVNAILADSQGTLWFARSRAKDGGLCQVNNGEAHCFGSQQLCPYGEALAEDSGGAIWVAGIDRICSWNKGIFTDLLSSKLNLHVALQGLQAVVGDADGSLLVGFEQKRAGGGLQRFVHGQFQSLGIAGFDSDNLDVTALLRDRDNGIWVATGDHGVYHLHGQYVDHIGPEDGLSGLSVQSMMQDQEGDIWLATGGGLDKFSQVRVATLGVQQGLPGDDIAAVTVAGDGSILASSGQGLGVISAANAKSLGPKDGLPGQIVTSFLRSKRGDFVWLGIDDHLATYSNGRFQKSSDVRIGPIVSMAEDGQGTLWLVAPAGSKIYKVFKKPFGQPVVEATDFFGQEWINEVQADAAGAISFITHSHDVLTVRNGKIQKIHGPAPDATNATFDRQSSFWLSSTSGLFLQAGESWRLLDSTSGLPCDPVQAFVFDVHANLWLHLVCGYAKIDSQDLEAWKSDPNHRVKPLLFDATDGARSGESSFTPSAAAAPDGTVWFATDTVLQMINPSTFHRNQVAPPVKIEGMVVDNRSYPVLSDVILPPNSRDIEIRFAALSFENPRKITFEYSLSGVGQPVQATAERSSAIYSNLGPGSYTFHVSAANDDGVWNHEGAALTFVIPPVFYQTTWFRVLVLLLLLLVVWMLMTYRIQRAEAALELRMGERLAERNRIARELHDTLLQGLQSFHLRFHVMANSMTTDDRSRKMLLDSMSKADTMILDVRDKVRDLRHSTERVGTLEDDLRVYLDELASSDHGTEFTLNVIGTARVLKPVVREELEALAREAIFNAIQHASARTIASEIRFSSTSFVFSCLDDGVGIPADVIEQGGRAGHWGLIGMRERVRKIGGSVELVSSSTGTNVVILLDARHAYADRLSTTGMLATLRALFAR